MSIIKTIKIFFTLVMFFSITEMIYSQTTIYTPEGQAVSGLELSGTPNNSNTWAQDWINYYSLDATIIGNPTRAYNCHGYAWVVTEGSGNYWLQSNDENKYFSDGVYSNDGNPSYIATTESNATHGCYEPYSDHSIRVIKNSYPVSSYSTQTQVSKWNDGPLVRHGLRGDIYAAQYAANNNDTPVPINFSVLKTTHYGTLSTHPKTWIGVDNKTHTLTGNVVVPSGATLTIKSGVTVNFNSNSIKSIGGTITVESGVTKNYVELKDGSVIKGLYSSLNTAVSDAVAGQTINVYSSNLNANVSIPSGITVNIKSSSTLNLNGYKLLLSGGSVVVESGANFPYAKLKNNYSTLLAYYPTLESAISDAQSGYTVELPSITYSGNISLTNKNNVRLKGAGVGNTTINGNITITNSDYVYVSDFSMGNFKNITLNGGRPYLDNIDYNNSNANSYIFAYDVIYTDIDGLSNIGASTSSAWNFYNSYAYFALPRIEGYDFGITANSGSDLSMYGASFCHNLIDLYTTGSTSQIYCRDYILSYNGATQGNVILSDIVGYCGYSAKRKDSNSKIEKIATEKNEKLKEADSALRDLLQDEKFKKGRTLTEESKIKVNYIIEKYLSVLFDDLSKSDLKQALRKLSVCYKLLDQESVYAEYISSLVEIKSFPSEIKRFLIPNLVSKGNYNEAIKLIDEISAYSDISTDLSNELLYEKGTILKYQLKERELSEKVFAELYKNGGDHILARYAKAQLENRSGLDDGNKEINKVNSESSDDFSISSYPNPFNPTATIEYQIPKDGLVNLVVYNTLGQVVAELVNRHQSSGKYSVQFNASNLPSGIYFYKIESGSFSKSMKMLLLK